MHIRNSHIALFIHRLYDEQNSCMSQAVRRISSGSRINSAADDAAGLAISEKVRARIRSLSAAVRNSEDAISLTATAESAMASMHAALQRMRELAVRSASDTNATEDRVALDTEYQQLLKELDDIAQQARFNGKTLLTGMGGVPTNLTIQTGPDTHDTFNLVIDAVTPGALSLNGSHLRTSTDAADALIFLDDAITRVSGARASLGASQSRLMSRIQGLGEEEDNLTEADSRIRDADIGAEMVRLTRARLLAHISAAMLAQANALAGNVLYLMANQMVMSKAQMPAGDAAVVSDTGEAVAVSDTGEAAVPVDYGGAEEA